MGDIKKLYNYGRSNGYIKESVTEDAFVDSMKDPNKAKEYYNYVVGKGGTFKSSPDEFAKGVSADALAYGQPASIPHPEQQQQPEQEKPQGKGFFGGLVDSMKRVSDMNDSRSQAFYQQGAAVKEEEKEAAAEQDRMAAATLPMSDNDRQRETDMAQLRTKMQQDSQNADAYNQVLQQLEGDTPSYMKGEDASPDDVVRRYAEAWGANTPEGQQAVQAFNQSYDDIIAGFRTNFEQSKRFKDIQTTITQQYRNGQLTKEEAEKQLNDQLNAAFMQEYGGVIEDEKRGLYANFINDARQHDNGYIKRESERIMSQQVNSLVDVGLQQIDRLFEKRKAQPGYLAKTALSKENPMGATLAAADQLYREAATRMADTKKGEATWGSVLGDLGRHILNKLPEIATAGGSTLTGSIEQQRVLSKIANANAYDNPETVLTDEEEVLYDAITASVAADLIRSENTSHWASAATLTADMLPFVEEIMVGQGLLGGLTQAGKKAIIRGVARKLSTGTWGRVLGKLAANVGVTAVNAAESAAIAAISPSTYALGMQNMAKADEGSISFNEDGVHLGHIEQQGAFSAFNQAYWKQVGELFTETGGNTQLMMRALQASPVGRYMGKTSIGQMMRAFDKTAAGQLLSKGAYNGIVGEMSEEWENTFYDACKAAFRAPEGQGAKAFADTYGEFVSADTQVPMLISFSIPAILGGAVSAGQYVYIQRKYKTAYEQMQQTLGSMGMSEEESMRMLDEFRGAVYTGDIDDIPAAIKSTADAYGRTKDEKERLNIALSAYAEADTQLAALQTAHANEQSRVKELYWDVERAEQQIDGMTNKSDGDIYHVTIKGKDNAADGYITGGEVTMLADSENNPRFSGNDVVTVRFADGSVQQMSANQLGLLEAPEKSSDRLSDEIRRLEAKWHNIDAFPAGSKVNVNGPMPTTTTVADVNDEGVVVDITDENGNPEQTTIPHEEAANLLEKAEPDPDAVTYTNEKGETMQLVVLGDGVYQTAERDEKGEYHTYLAEDLDEMGMRPVGEQQPTAGEEQPEGEPPAGEEKSSVPMDENGNPVWDQLTTADAAGYILGTYQGNKAGAASYAEDMLAEAKKIQKQAAKQKSKNLNLAERVQEDQIFQQMRKDADDAVKYWEQVGLAIANSKTEAEIAEEAARKAKMQEERQRRKQTEEGSGTGSMAERYNAAPKVYGYEGTITLPDGRELSGRYVLAPYSAFSPSHNPLANFAKTEGYPVTESGESINDRDYTNDKEEQQKVAGIAQNYNANALKNMPVVSDEGLIYNGNGRMMAGALAAVNGTDGAYESSLLTNGKQYGFDEETIKSMPHARVAFELDERLPYNTSSLAVFNEQETQTQSNTGKAAGYARKLTPQAISEVIAAVEDFPTIDAFFNDGKAPFELINRLIAERVIAQREKAEMVDGDRLSATGKERLSNILLGTVFNNETIRLMGDDAALKATIIRALPQILDNKGLKEFSLESDIKDAIRLLYEVRKSKMPFDSFVRQTVISDDGQVHTAAENYGPFQLLLAEEMSKGGVESFRNVLTAYNNEAKDAMGNQLDIFGEVINTDELKQLVLQRYGKETNERADSGSKAEPAAQSTPAGNAEVSQTPIGNGVFGDIYDQFKGKVKEAFHFLISKGGGDLLGVFRREGVGDIDLVWGDETGGLAHIISKHVGEGKSFASVDEAAKEIENIILTGKNDFENGDKIVFRIGSKLVTIRKNYRVRGKKIADMNWVLSAYDELAADGSNSAIKPAIQSQAAPATAKNQRKGTTKNAHAQEKSEKSAENSTIVLTDGRSVTEETAEFGDFYRLPDDMSFIQKMLFAQKANSAQGKDPNGIGAGYRNEVRHVVFNSLSDSDILSVEADYRKAQEEYVNEPNKTDDYKSAADDVLKEIYSRLQYLDKEGKYEHGAGSGTKSRLAEAELAFARQEVDTNPTDAQKEAGNYKKGHVNLFGFDITLENPKGSTRSGKDADGKEWSITMQNDYGYIRGTESVDGDHIDIYLGDNTASEKVFVMDAIDQKTGAFDEHKVLLGFDSAEAALDAYLANYEKGWKPGTLTEVSLDEFRKWIESSHRKTKPFSDYKNVKTEGAQNTPDTHGRPTDDSRTTPEENAAPEVSRNTIFTESAADRARERMRARLGRLNAGLDPEMLSDGIIVAGYYIERGARTFAAYAKAMIKDFGDAIRPYLKGIYTGLSMMPEAKDLQMDDMMTVAAFDVDNFDPDNEPEPPTGGDGGDGGKPASKPKIATQGVKMQNSGGKVAKNTPDILISQNNFVSLYRELDNATNPNFKDQIEWLLPHAAEFVTDYLEKNGNVLDPDALREYFAPIGYNGTNVPEYRPLERPFVRDVYEIMLQRAKAAGNPTVVFLTGHGGAGKSTATRNNERIQDLKKNVGLIYDSALNSADSLRRALRVAMDNGVEVKDMTIIPVYNDLVTSFKNTVERGLRVGRFLSIKYLVEDAFKENAGKIGDIHNSYPEISIIPIDNSNNNGGREVTVDEAIGWDYSVSEEKLTNLLEAYDTFKQRGLRSDQIAAIEERLSEVEGIRLGEPREGYAEQTGSGVLNNAGGREVREVELRVQRVVGSIRKGKHTKTGEDLWIVSPSERLSDADFKDLKKRARENGGYYSKFKENRGFVFTSEDAANKFNNLYGESITAEEYADSEAARDEGRAVSREGEAYTDGAGSAAEEANERADAEQSVEDSKKEAEIIEQIAKVDEAIKAIDDQLAILGALDTTDGVNVHVLDVTRRKHEEFLGTLLADLNVEQDGKFEYRTNAEILPRENWLHTVSKAATSLDVTICVNSKYELDEDDNVRSFNGVVNIQSPEGGNLETAYFGYGSTYQELLEDVQKQLGKYRKLKKRQTPLEFAKEKTKKPKSKKVSEQATMLSLFDDDLEPAMNLAMVAAEEQQAAEEQNNNPETTEDNGSSNSSVPPQDGGMGEGEQQAAIEPEQERMGEGGEPDLLHDGERSGSDARQHVSEDVTPAPKVVHNKNNFHNSRGKSLAPTTPKARFEANVAAIRLMRELTESGKKATAKDKAILAQYSGWGGLGTYFNNQWSPEYKTIHELFDADELHDAENSINTAYYTPTYIIDYMWDIVQRMGFKGGDILEGSAGIGNILAQIPTSINQGSAIQAVELDQTTGNILRLLYPDAQVNIDGFQNVDVRPKSKDLVITNVPFDSSLKLTDEKNLDITDKFGLIHNFCIAKNVRALREGGIGVFITTSGTLDKAPDLFKWLGAQEKTDVIGAFRLNNKTFDGAPVTSDIIVVRKRINGEQPPKSIDVTMVHTARIVAYDENPNSWRPTKDKDLIRIPVTYNNYFAEHPEHMGGVMMANCEMGDTFRPKSIGLHPIESKDQTELLKAWVRTFAEQTQAKKQEEEINRETTTNKEGSLLVNSKGEICVSQWGTAAPLDIQHGKKVRGRTKAECLRDYQEVRDALTAVLDYQATNADDKGLKPLLNKLNAAYDLFHKRYGNFHKNNMLSWLRNDVDYSAVAETEVYKESEDAKGKKTATVEKADVLKGRVLRTKTEQKASNVRDGIVVSIREKSRIDLGYIASLLGRNVEDVRTEALKTGLAFEDPASGDLVVKYEYLSGNVLDKLEQAKASNTDGRYDDNVRELERVCPKTIPAHMIKVSFGSTWVPANLYKEYIAEKTGIPAQHIRVQKLGAEWSVTFRDGAEYASSNTANGVHSQKLNMTIPVSRLVIAAINNGSVHVSKQVKDIDGQHTEVDKEATQVCNSRIDEYKDEFVSWFRDKMQADPETAAKIESDYNKAFNQFVPTRVSKEFIPEHFDGANQIFKLNEWQSQAAVRCTMEPLMIAHEVGTGKTFTMITSAMEMRRLGLAKKPMIVVQNATVQQFVADARRLYPRARILSMTDKDKGVDGRAAFYRKIKYNDWDIIIITQSAFNMIPESQVRKEQYIQEKIEEKEHIIELLEAEKAASSVSDARTIDSKIKSLRTEMTNMLQSIQGEEGESTKQEKKSKTQAKQKAARIESITEKAKRQLARKTDDVESFDDMDIDALFVDEAHEYKHLGFESMTGWGIKGIDKTASGKAVSLYCKMQAVFDKTGHKNVVFATGTPISNTAAEIWTFMKYLMPKDVLKTNQIYYFDDFVHNFGKITQRPEFKTNGSFKEVTRFAEYNNVPELVRMWTRCSDTVLEPAGLKDKVPVTEAGGKSAQDIFLPQTRALRSVMKYVRERLEEYENMDGAEKKENSSIPLTMYGIAMRAAIDPRLVLNAADEPTSKTNRAVEEVVKALDDSRNYNGTVAVFCDSFQRKEDGVVVFNLFEDIREKLIARGIPAEQIAIISNQSKEKKQQIFDKVNAGEIRVILGSTQKLGVGVNIQTRLFAEIHLDAPNRPMDYQQRVGRIIRQGNLHKEWGILVRLIRFGVEDSLDVTGYQRLKTKTSFSTAIMKSANDMNLDSQIVDGHENRSMEEDDSAAEFDNMIATISGSEFAILKSDAERKLRKLEAEKKQFEDNRIWLADAIRRNKRTIQSAEDYKKGLEDTLGKIRKAFPDGKVASVKVAGKAMSSDKVAEETYKKLNKAISEKIEALRLGGVSAMQYSGSEYKPLTTVEFELDGVKGRFRVMANVSMYSGSTDVRTYHDVTIPELGIDQESTKQRFIKGDLETVLSWMSGKGQEERIRDMQYRIDRAKKENESHEEKLTRTFDKDADIEKLQADVNMFTEKMKAEMEAKEAKYRELDKEVESVNLGDNIDLSDEEEEDDAEKQYGDGYDNDTEAQQLATDAVMEALENAGINVVLEQDDVELDEYAAQMAAVNDKFNRTIMAVDDKGLHDAVFNLGMPSDMLLAAGIADKPIRLYGSKIQAKMKKHGFSKSELLNLPMAVSKPIAVFVGNGSGHSVLTELSTKEGNVLVAIKVGEDQDADFDIVKSVYGKGEEKIVRWINEGKMLAVNKEKALDYLRTPAPIAGTASDQELNSAAKIVQNFDTAKSFDEKSENLSDISEAEFSIRKGAAPKKTGIGYKVFYRGKDGKLYPPMVANPNGADTPVGVWLNADAAPMAGLSKTGRPQVKAGGKGTQGGSGSLAYRPGWHLGEIPYAIQFNRKDENGNKTLFPKDFVWAEVEYAADVDYQKDAEAEGVNANGKFQHSLAGLKRVPEDGYYRYRTNPNPATDPWIITGAMKVNRVLTNDEVDEIVRKAGREPQKREMFYTTSGKVLGWADSTGIHLTPDGVNPNTPIHEYTHLWAKAMELRNPEGWESIKSIFRDTPFWEEVVNDQNYKNIRGNEDRICSEVLARYSGKRGAERMTQTAQELLDEAKASGSKLAISKTTALLRRVKDALQSFWNWVGHDLFGIHSFKNADEVADRVLYDLVSGTDLSGITYGIPEFNITPEELAKRREAMRKWMQENPAPKLRIGETLEQFQQRLNEWKAGKPNPDSPEGPENPGGGMPPVPPAPPARRNLRETGKEFADRIKAEHAQLRDELAIADYVAFVNEEASDMNDAKRRFIDAAAPIEHFQEYMLRQGAIMNDESNAYADTFLASGRVSQTVEELNRDVIHPMASHIASIMKKYNLEDFGLTWHNLDVEGTGQQRNGDKVTAREFIGLYTQAKDAQEAEELGLPDRGQAGFKKLLGVDHKEIIRMMESTVAKEDIDKLWELINKATKFALKNDYEAGRITQEVYEENTKREYYVPQRGWRERDEEGIITEYQPVGKRYGDPYNAALIKAKGRTSLASDPFQYIMSIDHSSIVSSENNKIKQKFLEFCLLNEQLGIKTDAFHVKKYWIMNVLDADGNVQYDADGNAKVELSYSQPDEKVFEHDKKLKQEILKLHRALYTLNNVMNGMSAESTFSEARKEATRKKIEDVAKKITELENKMQVAWTAVDSTLLHRTSGEKPQHWIEVKKDGQLYTIEVRDEKLANAINKSWKHNQEELLSVQGKMRNATRRMSAMLTQYNPEFALSNFSRDFQVAVATIGAEHPTWTVDFLKNFAKCQRSVAVFAANDKVHNRSKYVDSETGRYLQEYMRAGAATGFSYMQDLKALNSDFEKMINEGNIQKGLSAAAGVFSMLTEMSETSVRFAGYMTARQHGMGVNEAAYFAKELTTNFDRAGEMANSGWMAWYSFFRATMNGNIKFFRAFKQMPLRYAFIGAGFLAAGILNQLLNPNDPDDEIWVSDYMREGNFVIGKVRIPTAHFLRMFFAAGVNIGAFFQGSKTWGKAIFDTADYAMSEMLPNYVNIPGNATEWNDALDRPDFTGAGLLQGFMPTTVSPIADIYFNRDYKGATINREPFAKSQEGTKDILLGKESTSEIYKAIAQGVYEAVGGDMNTKYQGDDPAWRSWLFDVSPSSTEHVVEGYLAMGGAELVIQTGSAIYSALSGKGVPAKEIPFLRKFYSPYDQESAYRQQYYLLNGRVKEFDRNLKDYKKNNPTKYNQVVGSQQYKLYEKDKKLLKTMKENPTKEDVKQLYQANKEWWQKRK